VPLHDSERIVANLKLSLDPTQRHNSRQVPISLLGMWLFAATGSRFAHSTIQFFRSRPAGLPQRLLYTPLQYDFLEGHCERIMSETTQTFLALNIDLFVVAAIAFGLMIL
jgi:hypothetical protein